MSYWIGFIFVFVMHFFSRIEKSFVRRCFQCFHRSLVTVCHEVSTRQILHRCGRNLWIPPLKVSTPWRQFAQHSPATYTVVQLPALSPAMEKGTILKWAKKEGEWVKEGEVLAETETDKAYVVIESPEQGYLATILVPEGTHDVSVGTPICIIARSKDNSGAKGGGGKRDSKGQEDRVGVAGGGDRDPATPGPRVYASPLAKKLAQHLNLHLRGTGSGVHGSMKSADVKRLASEAPVAIAAPRTPVTKQGDKGPPRAPPRLGPPVFTDHPVTATVHHRALSLLQSKQMAPHYHLWMRVEVGPAERLAKQLSVETGQTLQLRHLAVKAAALACRQVPQLNAAWLTTAIRKYEEVDVTVGSGGSARGVVKAADTKSLPYIAEQMNLMASSPLQPHLQEAGTITLMELEVKGWTTVIEPEGQAAVLALGSVEDVAFLKKTPKPVLSVKKMVWGCLSADHRVVDGAEGAQWLTVFRDLLQDPASLTRQ